MGSHNFPSKKRGRGVFKMKRDEIKEQRLNEMGIRVLRFKDEDVMNNTEGVIAEIKEWIKTHTP